MVGALRAEDFEGPWVFGKINNVYFPTLVDTACPFNILSHDMVGALGLNLEEKDMHVSGVGEGQVKIIGTCRAVMAIGSYEHAVMTEFLVSDAFSGFAFFGLEEQREFGVVIDTGRSQLLIRDHTIPFWRSKSELVRCAAVEAKKIDNSIRIKVELTIPTVLPANSNVITTGKLIFPPGVEPVKGQYLIDPVLLRQEYGLLSPRTVVKVGDDCSVPVLIKNPLPQGLRLLRKSRVGYAELTLVDGADVKDLGGPAPSVDPETGIPHPLDKVKLSHLDAQPELKARVGEMLLQHPTAISRGEYDLGLTSWIEHDIQLKPGHEEPAVEPQRSYPLHKRDIILKTVDELEEKGVIESANSAWRTFPVLAKKKNAETGEWEDCKRFCLDLRKCNEKTLKHSRLLCKVHEVVDAMKGAKYFTKLDLIGGYHQVPLKETARDYTAFCTPSGRQYRYRVMTFGLCNAGQTFSNLMEMVLSQFNWHCALSYLDDVIVWSASADDHLRDVSAILTRMELAGLKVRPEKCEFFKDSVEMLGFVVSQHGIHPDDRKVAAIKNWPVPNNDKDLLSFLATANFYRRFIRSFSTVAWSLYQLTHQGVKWQWKAKHLKAFNKIKTLLCSAPVMIMPDTSKPFWLDTDWSRRGCGWVLNQEGPDGHLHPVAYGSKSLTKSESRYGSTKGEFYALCEGVLSNRHYLEGAVFTIRCDNRALSYLTSYKTKDLTFRTARMLEKLAGFGEFKVQFIPGKANIPADALSRIPKTEMNFSELPTENVMAPIAVSREQFDWKKEQDRDDDLKTLKTWLTEGSKPSHEEVSALSPCLRSYWFSFDQFRLLDGVVVRVWTEVDGSADKMLKVVPLGLRNRILEGHHDQLAHPGVTRLNLLLRRKFFWYKMSDDSRRYVETCSICQVTKAKVTKAPLIQHPLSYMSQKVFMDVKGVLSTTERGNAYYIVLVDGWSKWVAVIPLPDIRAVTVYSAIYNQWITQMGQMVQLHSDKGSSLVGDVAKQFVDMMNIKQTTTVSYHQMANGEAERNIRSTIQLISSILAEEGDLEWDLACPKVAWALNVTPSTTTGQSPWLVKHSSGEEAIIPADVAVENLPEGRTVDVVVRSLRERQARMFKKVSKATGNALRRQKAYYDRGVRGQEIQEGDTVRYDNHVRNPSIDKSFQLKYVNKLFRVTSKLSEVNYEIEDAVGKKIVVHFNQLKKVPTVNPVATEGLQAETESVQEETAVRRSGRQRQTPARLRDYDLSSGPTVG